VKAWIAALVVEDDAILRFDLAQTLQAEGYKTFEAADATEAIAVLEANSEIRVVFTDIHMPGTMDGLALSHYVRKRWPPTIIVVSSGRCTPGQEEMPTGVIFVGKPYAPEVLGKVLEGIRQQLQ
jgi:two-component system, response regulator PdtaR